MSSTYSALLHFDPSPSKTLVTVGEGYELHSVCGQQEWIAVTNIIPLVECKKCIHIIGKRKYKNFARFKK